MFISEKRDVWPALAVSGFIVFLFGLFLILTMGALGFVIFLAGPVMMVAGLILKEPEPAPPDDRTKRYCKFCLAEVDVHAEICPECGFPKGG